MNNSTKLIAQRNYPRGKVEFYALARDKEFDVCNIDMKIDEDNIIYLIIEKTVTHEESEKILSILGIKKYGE
jgi:hypothetical protein